MSKSNGSSINCKLRAFKLLFWLGVIYLWVRVPAEHDQFDLLGFVHYVNETFPNTYDLFVEVKNTEMDEVIIDCFD
jgi:hypothetical protein